MSEISEIKLEDEWEFDESGFLISEVCEFSQDFIDEFKKLTNKKNR